MKISAWLFAVLVVLTAGQSQAASREVQYGPPPAREMPPPAPTPAVPPLGSPARVIYTDNQAHIGSDGDEIYTAYRVKILAPEALPLGNISATWNPSGDDFTVHRLSIIRAGQVIDVLATTKFQIIQRENNLDYAMLDGQLTATIQTPGLQVGDELEFAATIHRHDPTLGDRSHALLALPAVGSPGAFRLRVVWPDSKAVRWQATPDVGKLVPSERAGQREIIFELRDPPSVVPTDGAPIRFNLRRLIEYSEFNSWAELSNRLWSLFDKASTLAPDSPVRLEAAKIARSTKDPAERAEAALRLVQDRIRYVYIGLNDGNYRPVSADDTWNRRFGDCKAKAVLLMALLRELGIENEAVLVNSKGGDGTDQRLPTPEMFDHVVVRATVGSRRYWLDGTRLGDRRLAALPAPIFRWALPLRAAPVDLEAVPATPLDLPKSVEVVDVDASAGFDVPAKFKVQEIVRGDEALPIRTQLSSLSSQDAERAEEGYFRKEMSWIEPDSASWRYDELRGTLVLSMSGQGKPEWQGNEQEGRSLDIYGAGFTPPNELRRPKEQDQTAPWVTEFPEYKCWATTIKLPPETSRLHWDYAAQPANARLGGKEYWRVADLRGGVMHTVMSIRTYTPEISADQAKEMNERLPNFDNKISRVFQTEANASDHPGAAALAKDIEKSVDWASPDAPCAAPSGTVGAGSIEDPQAAYDHGDYATALRLFRLLADQGDANAQSYVGLMYATGSGVPQDYAAAVEWFRKAADQGNAYAQSRLAGMYYDGQGLAQDYVAARIWYQKAADNGDVDGEFGLGVIYEHGYGVPEDDAAALNWYRKAAAQGKADAQVLLGYDYENGAGVTRDYAAASDWYRKAADQGDAYAEFRLAVLYDSGKGVPQDSAAALSWYRKAADHGSADAALSLGDVYEYGAGVAKDNAIAATWYRKAADQGSNAAQLRLASKYEEGNGVKRDLVQAYFWFSLASKEGSSSVIESRDLIAVKLTSAQLSEAQRLVKDWKPKTTSR